jgi:hypothetical protein
LKDAQPGAIVPRHTHLFARAGLALAMAVAGAGLAGETGLVGYWKLDEGTGTLAADSSPAKADAVIRGAQWVEDAGSRRLEFYGSGEVAESADAGQANLQGAFSIGFWLKPHEWPTPASQGIVSKKRSDRDRGYVVYNNGDTPTRISIRVAGTRSGRDITSASDVASGVWQHWAVTYDPESGRAAWYRNGLLDVAVQVEPFGDLSCDAPLEIGHSQTWGGYFAGSLAGIRIHDRALTAEEVAAEFQSAPALVAAAGAAMVRRAAGPTAPRWRVVTPRYPTGDVVVAGCTVQEFGAKGDGTADDTDAFLAAMDLMHANGGGAVFAPEGRYAIRGHLKVPTGVTLRGDWARPGEGRPVRGTVLMAYEGRGAEKGWPFLSLGQCSGIRELSIWYPQQDAGAIVPYPFCIKQTGWESVAIVNVTLVNPYQGIAIGPQGNELHLIRGLHGTPLALGLQIDFVTDTGRSSDIHLGPDLWSESGLPGAPPRDGPHARWMRAHGTALRILRYDWIYSAFADIRGYRTGIEILASPRGAANGQLYGYRVTDCDTALSAVEILFAGISFTACTFAASEAGVATQDSFGSTLLFHSCDIRGDEQAADLRGNSESTVLFQHCTFAGEVAREAGNLVLVNCRWTSAGNHLSLGEAVNAATVAGCHFAGPAQIADRSASELVRIDSETVPELALPVVPPPTARACRPARADLHVVTDAPSSACRDGVRDDTAAIQGALDAAGRAGGGVVFLPGGEYAVRGTLSIPSGVELRGVYDVPHHSLGKGSTLRVFAGRGEESGPAFIVMAARSGLRGVTFYHPEQELGAIVPYPFLVQGRGEGIYVLDITAVNSYRMLDFMSYRCDRHLIDYPAGVALRTGIAIGGGSVDGELRNAQLQTHYWNRSPYPESPGVVRGPGAPRTNLVWEYQYDHLDAFVVGDCRSQRQYQNCVFGSSRGLRFVTQNGRGASGLVLGHGTDGSQVAAAFDGVAPGGIDLINSQLVSMASSDPERPLAGRRYVTCGSDGGGDVRLFNSTFWGQPERTVAVSGGTLILELASFANFGPFAVSGGRLALTSCTLGTGTGAAAELELTGAGRVALACNLTPYGMRADAVTPAAAVSAHCENQRSLPVPPEAREIAVRLDRAQRKRGLALRAEDGESRNAPADRAARYGWQSVRHAPWADDVYVMYWLVEFPAFREGKAPRVSVSCEIFDESAGELLAYYDSSDAAVRSIPQSPGAWKVAGTFPLAGSKTWRTLEFALPDAHFGGRCNGGDLRFDIRTRGVPPTVAAVKLTRTD